MCSFNKSLHKSTYNLSLGLLFFVAVISGSGRVHARKPILPQAKTRLFTAHIKDTRGRIMTRSFYANIYTYKNKKRRTNTAPSTLKPKPKPKPLAIVLHGRAATEKARVTMPTQQFHSTVRYLLKLGYTVVVPTRIGYGKSTGADLEAAGTCYKRDYAAGLQAAATQTLAVLNTMRRQADIAPTGTVLIGHSYGGIVALATAAKQPMGIRAVINISGGAGGNPYKHPKKPCAVRNLQKQLSRYGRTSRVPSVWIYAENDRFWGADIPQQWLQSYRHAGGVAYFYNVGQLGFDGHTLFSHFPKLWQKKSNKWLQLEW